VVSVGFIESVSANVMDFDGGEMDGDEQNGRLW